MSAVAVVRQVCEEMMERALAIHRRPRVLLLVDQVADRGAGRDDDGHAPLAAPRLG